MYDIEVRTVAFTAPQWQANFVGDGPVEVI
jgi:hypothetical protein